MRSTWPSVVRRFRAVAAVAFLAFHSFISAAAERSDTLRTEGLAYDRQFDAIWAGDFPRSGLSPLSMEFATVYGRYLETFGRQCAAYLPSDKVAITRKMCSREQYTVNGYGVRTGSSTCIAWSDVPTGLYADPASYRTKLALDDRMQREVLKHVLHGGLPQAGTDYKETVAALGDDFETLLRANRCDGDATRRFQDNLRRFADGEAGIVPPGAAAIVRMTRVPGAATETAITRMVADAIAESAKSWNFNRFVAGSVEEVKITRRDREGRPTRAKGYYLFDGISGRKVGTVDLEFADGMPRCLYFMDAPGICRAPSRRVSNSFEKGDYEHAR